MRMYSKTADWALGAILLLATPGVACAKNSFVSVQLSAKAAANIVPLYSAYLARFPNLHLVAQKIGDITLLQFQQKGGCPAKGCFTTAVIQDQTGAYHQVFTQEADGVQYNPDSGSYPEIRVNGFDWSYTSTYGYIADLRGTGKAFYPDSRPAGQTAEQLKSALIQSGWPGGNTPVPEVIRPVRPGGNAPETIVVAPDQTTHAGAEDCVADTCHIWLMIYNDGRWQTSTGTAGTGLVSVLPPDNAGQGRIGIAVRQGINILTWDDAKNKWVMTGSTVMLDKRFFQ